jgi:hypothetical protein
MANHPENIRFVISVDSDDNDSQQALANLSPSVEVYVGEPRGKIDAINRDMPDPASFDVLLLASDDMVPVVQGYDDVIVQHMTRLYPDGDGVLFFNDGYLGSKLNTLVICGSAYYARFGYIYYPGYRSTWCDNEFMRQAYDLGRQTYLDQVIIRHESPYNNATFMPKDDLLQENETFFEKDKALFYERYPIDHDISVLICTMPSRRILFDRLVNRIRGLTEGLSIRVEILSDDSMEYHVGLKRAILLTRCRGRYACFIDDDDNITDEYFAAYEAVLPREPYTYDAFSMTGMYIADGKRQKPFYHSIRYNRWYKDAAGFYRFPNHLNLIKTDICKAISYASIRFGEDYDFALRLNEAGLIKKEYSSNALQYLYHYDSNKQHYKVINATTHTVKPNRGPSNSFMMQSNHSRKVIPLSIPLSAKPVIHRPPPRVHPRILPAHEPQSHL